MIENTNTKQFYPGPILNNTLEITRFLFNDPTQIKVKYSKLNIEGVLEDIILTYGTQYEVTKVLPSDINAAEAALTASTGTVTIKNITVVEGEKLTVYRETPLIQDTKYPRTGAFPAASHEGALDYVTMQNQEQQEQIDRSLKIPNSVETFDAQMPTPLPARALKINADGTGFEMSEFDPDTALVLTEQYRTEAQAAAEVAVASKDTSIEKANIATEKAAVATTQANRVEDIYTEAVPVLNQIISDGQSGLSETIIEGQQSLANASDALRQTQITNCLLEIPQNIKLELVDNVLTLKAGSKVIVPNGAGVFDEVVIDNDITFNPSSLSNRTGLLYVKNSLGTPSLGLATKTTSTSGATTPSVGWHYNTTDNIVYRDGNAENISLPIAIVTNVNGTGATAINQVFNGFGYIGSHLWVDKGVKALIPNGRNVDSNLNNIEVTTQAIYVYTRNLNGDVPLWLDQNGTLLLSAGLAYDEKRNVIYIIDNENTTANRCQIAMTNLTNGVVNSFQPKQPFRAVDHNDYSRDIQQLLLEKTPNRFLTFNAKRKLTLAANTHIQLDTQYDTKYLNNTANQTLNIESMLDSGATLQAGKAYSIFLVPSATGGVELKVSLNSTAPTGYSPLDTRRIGGFSTLCRDAGTISWHANHPLSGFVAGDILPQSVWTIYHRPYASPNNCIYIPAGIPFWRTIYDHSGTLSTTSFEYGGTVTRARTFYGHMQDMMHAGYILPTYEQAAISGYGCEPLKAVSGKAEASVTTAGGHVNESNNRIISIYGAEDCAGCTWKLTTIGAIGGSNWSTDASVGVHQYGSVNVLHVGGDWFDSGRAGPFATIGDLSALTADSNCASFGVSYPLPRKSEGNV